jgi:O-antigen ligase
MNAADARSATIHGFAAQAIADAPLLGTGANTFESTAHLYGADLDTARTSPGALLEAMVELGVPASLALILACAGLFVCCARGVLERGRNAIYPCLGVGATLLVACDAIANASLQNPLVAMVWCMIMGIACAQSLPSADRRPLPDPARRA